MVASLPGYEVISFEVMRLQDYYLRGWYSGVTAVTL